MTVIDALTGPVRPPASGKPTSAVVLLHGYGADGNDLIGLAPFFAEALPGTVFLSPHAPIPLEGGFGGRQWFSLRNYDPNAMRNDPKTRAAMLAGLSNGAEDSIAKLNTYLDQVLAHYELGADRLALMGFSQGTMMSLHVGLRRKERIGAILGYSGAMIAPERLAQEIVSRPPVRLVHGDADPVVPVQALDDIKSALTANAVPFDAYVIPGLQHGIDGNGAKLGADFLRTNWHKATPMIGPILAVTMTVTDLAPIESAYSKYLGYAVVERGKVDAQTAATWGAPTVSGHDYMVMQPESGATNYLRFVVTAPYPDYKPLRTYGWNSTEILVSDVDALAERLKSSPFEIVGAPRNLSSSDQIKAMQVMGPAHEFLYLTTIKDPNHVLGQAKSFVDRLFIVINGGRSIDALIGFYRDVLGADTAAPMPVRMTALNKIHGLDSETKHPLSTAKLKGPFMVELDQYPKDVTDRAVRPGDLPPGTAMVTFAAESLAGIKVQPIAAPGALKGLVYGGGQAEVIKGPNGELLELVQPK